METADIVIMTGKQKVSVIVKRVEDALQKADREQ
jgi:hypothetical protein